MHVSMTNFITHESRLLGQLGKNVDNAFYSHLFYSVMHVHLIAKAAQMCFQSAKSLNTLKIFQLLGNVYENFESPLKRGAGSKFFFSKI